MLIIETLQTMMRATEILPYRAKILMQGGGTKVRDLLVTLTTLPEIVGGYPDSFFTLDLRCDGSSDDKKANSWNISVRPDI